MAPPAEITKNITATAVHNDNNEQLAPDAYFHVYGYIAQEVVAPICTGTANFQEDIARPCSDDNHHVLEAGTRVRLYYPMKAHEGSVYMAAATVDAITAQFSLLWVRVYEDNVAGKPLRFVSNFEV